jgi:photosystem II stability/assembly factor-like uncharacterized protein
MKLRAFKILLAGLLVSCLAGATVAAAENTDQPAWRARNGVLLTVVRAGNRLIAAGDRGTILASDDMGVTWTPMPSGTDAVLTDAIFPSPAQGWVVGQDSTILHTGDGGAHWSVQNSAPGSDQSLFSVASLGGTHLIATGAYALALQTTDGGHWSPVKLPSMDEDYHLNCVVARGPDVLAMGEAGHGFIRADETWLPMPVPYDGSQFGCLTTADGTLYSFGLRGSLFVCAPDAANWTRLETGEERPIFGGSVMADGTIALVGGNGLVMLLDPRTRALRTLPAPSHASLSGVAEAADGALILVGDDGIHRLMPPPANDKAASR